MSMIKHARARRFLSQGRSQASLARSSAIMASGTLVSRILGMVRNALIVMALGATGSGAADAFNTANNLPTYLYNMMIGGILNAILVPQIVQALRRRNGQEVVNRLLTAAATLMLAVTCIATAAAPLIFTLNANSLAQGQWRTLSFAFAFWFMPQVFFYGLYALWGQVLNARSSFGPYMWSPVLNNIISIASILLYLHLYGRYTTGQGAEVWDWRRITLIGATTTLGIAVQALILYIPLVRSGFRPRIIFGVRGLGLGKTVKVALWALAGVGVASLSNWITSNLGSYAVTASEQPEYANVIVPSTTMWLNAYLVYMLPQSLVVTSIITALFTRMSEKAAAGDAAGVREDLSLGLRSAGVFTVLATAGICVLAVPALQLFTPSITLPEAQASAPMLIALALGIVPQGIWFGTQRVMLAYSDTKRLLLADVVVGVIPVILCVLAYFVAPANHWMTWAGAANTISQIGGCVVVIPMMRSHLPSLDGRKIVTTHLRLIMAAAPAVVVGILLNAMLGDIDADSSLANMTAALGHIAVVATVMSLIYLLMGRVIRIEEITVAFRPFSRILSTLGRRLPGAPGRAVLAAAAWLSPPQPQTQATAQMAAVQTPPPPPPPPPAQAVSGPSSASTGATAHGAVGYTSGGTQAVAPAPPPPAQAHPHSWGQPGQMGSQYAGGHPSQPVAGRTYNRQPGHRLAPPPPAASQAAAAPPPPSTGAAAGSSHHWHTPGHAPANAPGSIPPSLPPSIPPSRVATGRSALHPSHSSAHTGHITPVWSPQTVTMGSTGSDGQPSQGRRRMSEATPIGSGRYGLLGTLSTTLPRIVRHRGVDTILDRDVTILVLTDATLHRDNVLESASRAVLVEDQRLQQVYDVERAEPSVIVTEPLTGRTFSSLVSRGMPPEQARAIIGETAQALDAGARKGLHHLNLSPESIRVLPDGRVKVSGLGIEAAALDLESRVAGHDPTAADRADARSLVEILYYGLTGRWPGKRPGIPSAPRLGGVPVKPSTLVPGIDPILDELCERTWSSQPPISAAEVARSLGTWGQVAGYHESGPTQRPSSQHPSSNSGATGGSGSAAAGATAAVSAAGAGVANAARGVLDRLRRSGAGKSTTVSAPAGQMAPSPVQPEPAPSMPATSDAPAEQTSVIEAASVTATPATQAPDPQQPESATAQEQPADDAYVQVTGPANPIPNVLSTASETVPGPAPVPVEPFTGSFPAFDDDEDEEIDPEAARREQRTTRSVLITFVLMVIALLVVASYIVYQTIGIPFADKDRAAADTVPSASAQENGGGGSQQPAAPQPTAAKPEIAGVNVVNNPSSQAANNQQYLADGDTSRPWFSHNSSSQDLSQPIDIEIKLKNRAKVSEIDLQGTNEGGQVEVRATDLSNAGGGTVLAQGPFTSGSTTLKVDNPQEVDTLVIRVTQLPKNSEPGEYPYKATVTEVTIK
ncbi:lipid II flippase MurJ [Actinomyces sp.]|uniref:lipid II flippase MurJ n=1 Tax=Actinomyces sp. TaxID=29317 RepID=UPI003613637D